MRNAAQPVEIRAAAITERRHQLAQLRMHAPAVVALVVVLAEHLPVRRHLVADRVTDPQFPQGVARAGARRGRLPAQARAPVPAHIVEGAQPSLAVAYQDDAFAEDIEQAELPGLHQFFLAPDTDPVAAEDPLLLHGEYALRAIPARRQGGFQAGQPRGWLVGAHGSFSRSSLAANPGINVARCLPRGASRR